MVPLPLRNSNENKNTVYILSKRDRKRNMSANVTRDDRPARRPLFRACLRHAGAAALSHLDTEQPSRFPGRQGPCRSSVGDPDATISERCGRDEDVADWQALGRLTRDRVQREGPNQETRARSETCRSSGGDPSGQGLACPEALVMWSASCISDVVQGGQAEGRTTGDHLLAPLDLGLRQVSR